MYPSRVLGLSKNQRPPRLLSQVGKESAQKPTFKQLKVPKAFDDPPLSSDEDDDQGTPVKAPKPSSSGRCSGEDANVDALLNSSGSSGDERAARGRIQRTTFTGKTGPVKRKSEEGDPETSQNADSANPMFATTKWRRLNGKGTTYGGNGSHSQTPASSAEHLQDERGFTKVKSSKATYGKRKPSSQTQIEKKETKPKLLVPEPLVSPEKPKAGKLRAPSGSPPPPSTRSSLRLAQGDGDDDKLKTRVSPRRRKPALQTVNSIESLLSAKKKKPKLRAKKLAKAARSPSPPPAVFKMPTSFSQFKVQAGDGAEGSLPDIDPDSDDSVDGKDETGAEPEADAAATSSCPWCGEPVDKATLNDFSKGKRMNVRQQTKFCHKHRKQTALETWEADGYPDVQWQDLTERFEKHRAHLLSIVNGKSSHYRSLLADRIASGKARSLRKEDNLNPGYYGPRGFNLMCDYLVGEFGGMLKARAVDDRVIAGRGSAAFIQAVLVAELAVRLVEDDMGVGEEEARRIMEETKALGELVHEEQ
ncbi:hypothetical protein JDV02_001677 [Purpureocillium takamizusanense]|uniref:Restriction of telomere capping protein 4 n=1 Tax=Purpureocillium takamizusanense TaxID=2060973 RepID=A0A9Q8V825_9HYPO|nr:uncharacterized protein JDV02_001677 [Purpureocillium takamizusanense]UNI15111.1 hypothetical protein JDV02_001677 [Purpureocillium takamizusanense]